MSQSLRSGDVIEPSGLGRRLPFGLGSLLLLVLLAATLVILLMWLIQSPGEFLGSFQTAGGVRWWVIGAGIWLGLAAFSFLASWMTGRRRILIEDDRVVVTEPFGGKRIFDGADARSALITGTGRRFGQGDLDIEYTDGRRLRLDGTGFRAADLQKVAQLLLATPNTAERAVVPVAEQPAPEAVIAAPAEPTDPTPEPVEETPPKEIP